MKMLRSVVVGIIIGLALNTNSPAATQKTPNQELKNSSQSAGVPAAVLEVFPAVVRIYVVAEGPGGGRIEKMRFSGSGAIFSPDGYMVTNHHVAGNAVHVVCNLADHQEVPARLVGTDPLADIAVLKIDTSKLKNPDAPLPTARWGDSGSPLVNANGK
jgi:serine protease Do